MNTIEYTSAEEAVKMVKSGDRVFAHGSPSAVQVFFVLVISNGKNLA